MNHNYDPVDSAQSLFQTLAHPIRLRLLLALCSGEKCVCELMARFDRPQPYISQQLAELRDAGLVASRREGRRIYYRLSDARVCTVLGAAGLCTRRVQVAAQPCRLHGCA